MERYQLESRADVIARKVRKLVKTRDGVSAISHGSKVCRNVIYAVGAGAVPRLANLEKLEAYFGITEKPLLTPEVAGK